MSSPHPPLEGERKAFAVTALSLAPAAAGCAIGLLLSKHIKRRHRDPVATAFVALGTAAVVPIAADTVKRLVRGPTSRHGANRTLDEIRHHDGLPVSEEEEHLGESTMVDFQRAAQPDS